MFTAGKLPQNVRGTPSKKAGTVYRTVPHGHETSYYFHDLYKYCSLRSFPDRTYLSYHKRVIGFVPYKPSPYSAEELEVFIYSIKVQWLLLCTTCFTTQSIALCPQSVFMCSSRFPQPIPITSLCSVN